MGIFGVSIPSNRCSQKHLTFGEMRKSKFTETQILSTVRGHEAGKKVEP